MIEINHQARAVRARSLAGKLALIAACSIALAAEAHAQFWNGQWKPVFGNGPAANVNTATMFDFDGVGPEAAVPVVATSSPHHRVLAHKPQGWVIVGEEFSGVRIFSVISHDPDGDGPLPAELIVGGYFFSVGAPPRTMNWIARWDGSAWQPMAAGLNGPVYSLISFDPDGPGPLPPQLIAGGAFEASYRVARWNGASWQPMGTNLLSTSAVYAFASYDPDSDGPLPPQLIAGGTFHADETATAAEINNIARWDGTTWVSLNNGVLGPSYTFTGVVDALSVHDFDGDGPQPPQLIAGGRFTSITGGIPANQIARWDGTNWSAMGSGLNYGVRGLTDYDPDGSGPQSPQLIASGYGRVARWDGAAWQQLGPAFTWTGDYGMMAIGPGTPAPNGQPRLLLGGEFTAIGGSPVDHVAEWDGTEWTPLAQAPTNLRSVTLFDLDGSGPQLTNGTVQWDGTAWTPVPAASRGSLAGLMTFDPDGPGPLAPRFLATDYGVSSVNPEDSAIFATTWNSPGWEQLPGGFNGSTLTLSALDFTAGQGVPQAPQLIATGDFTLVDSTPVNRIARWDGAAWQPMGSGFTNSISAKTVYDPDGPGPLPARFIVGGTFTRSGTTTVNRIAQWDGAAWQPLGTGMNGTVSGLIVYDADDDGPLAPQLIAYGLFTTAGDLSSSRIARWDGAAWQSMSGGVDNTVSGVTIYDPDGSGPLVPQLIVTGAFTNAGGAPANHVARWDGSAWHTMGNGVNAAGPSINYDSDGAGPVLPKFILSGQFPSDPSNAYNVGSWNGTEWQLLADGINGSVQALSVFDPDGEGSQPPQLIAAGRFTRLGERDLRNLARWDGSDWHEVGNGLDFGVFPISGVRLIAYTPPDEQVSRLVAFSTFISAGGLAVPGITMLVPSAGPADFGSVGGQIGSDGQLDNNDLIAFIDLFFAQDARADVGGPGGTPGADGNFDNNDFIVFIELFFGG